MVKRNPLPGNQLRNIKALDDDYKDKKASEGDGEIVSSVEEANVVTSLYALDLHRPVLDLDLACELVPSSTPGHYHLYINKSMTWAKYRRLLEVLAEVGIIEPGYAKASIARGFSAVRLPGVVKGKKKKQEPIVQESTAFDWGLKIV